MSARTDLATALQNALGTTFRVVAYDVAEVISKPTVMVYRERVTAGPSFALQVHTFALWVVGPGQMGEQTVAKLDDLLDDVLGVLDDLPQVTWSEALYQVLDDKYPAFKVTAEVTTRKDY